MNLLSWGNYPSIISKTFSLLTLDKLKEYNSEDKEYIPFGNGRSYGDSALNDNILHTKSYNHFLKFSNKNCSKPFNYFLEFNDNYGLLHLQSGALLQDIIEAFVPRGWFLIVTPGTKQITIGGAIASDVHGKNHHVEGCFSECVKEMTIMLEDGEIVTCKRGEELFLATCGGMGLTGVIIDAKIFLKKINSKNIQQTTIKTANLKETFDAFEKYKHLPYSVAWIDCLANKEERGKCLLMTGGFADDGDLNYTKKSKLNIPFNFPSFALNKLSVKAFNWLYYNKAPNGVSHQKVDIDTFFYPLDSIDNWNRIYGKNGFIQYQFILPKESSNDGLQEILTKITDSGKGSFLAVLKLYGRGNSNYLSFPIEGYSLALDFKIEDGLFELLNELDEVVTRFKGRIYLSKDARVSKETFEKGYPLIKRFRDYRKANKMDKKFNSLQSKRLGL